jgi:hypothetical protein
LTWGAAYSNTVDIRRLIPVKTLNGLYLSGFDVSRIMTNPTVKAFYESFADNVIDPDQIQGRNQISVPNQNQIRS